jgi:hypothetical protein
MMKEGVIRAEWDRLPMLLTRKQVLAWTGMSRCDLDVSVETGRVRTFRANVKRKFLKVDVAKIVGFE